MVLGQPVGHIKLRGGLAKPGRRLGGRVPHLGPEDYLPFNAKWSRPTIPSGWDINPTYADTAPSPNTRASPDSARMK